MKANLAALEFNMVNVCIPMAGRGKRFADAGYADPKPFIKVGDQRMIEMVIQNINGQHASNLNYIFILLKSFVDEYGDKFEKFVSSYCYKHTILYIDEVTQGAACTALVAKDLINSDEELVITDCDHVCLDKDHINNGIKYFRKYKAEGGFWNFLSDDPKYSYVRINNGYVKEVAEKQVISNIANTGSYYFAKGSDFVKYAEEMIKANDRTRGEYYVAPVYRYMFIDNKKVLPYVCNAFFSLGVPSDLTMYKEINGIA